MTPNDLHKGALLARDLRGIADRIEEASRARDWLSDHGAQWDGSTHGVNMRGIATKCDGHTEAVAILGRVIEGMHEEIYQCALGVCDRRLGEAVGGLEAVTAELRNYVVWERS